VLITIDTLRAGNLGLYGYGRATTPRIDAWFGGGAIFERSYSTEASTSPSVISILSGLAPQEHGVRLFYQLLEDEVRVLPDLLGPEYQCAAFVSNMVLTDEAIGLGARFEHYDDYVSRSESTRTIFERNARRTTDAALGWLATHRDPSRPLFLWVHYIDPHGPYLPPGEWPNRFPPAEPRPIPLDSIPPRILDGDLTDGNEYVRRYDAEIAWTDHQVGRLLNELEKHVDAARSLFLLTADHGESMMDHERWFTHGYHVYDEIVRVPLLLRGPGVPSGRHQQLVSGVDIVPTVLGFAGRSVPEGLGGLDLRRPATWDAERAVFAAGSEGKRQWRMVVRGESKWIAGVQGEREVVELHRYDLVADPLELAPLRPRADWALQLLLEHIATDPDPAGFPLEYREGRQLSAPKVRPGVSPAELEALRSLGYAE
jgi:arylsulfatase A-like enzyme